MFNKTDCINRINRINNPKMNNPKMNKTITSKSTPSFSVDFARTNAQNYVMYVNNFKFNKNNNFYKIITQPWCGREKQSKIKTSKKLR